MDFLVDHPRVLLLASFVVLWLMAQLGLLVRERYRMPPEEDRETLSLVLSATLTLLGLILGFTFSMATSRYDQRKMYEEQEANAIGTEYVRLDLLPAEQAKAAKPLLVQYLDERIVWYGLRYGPELNSVDQTTAGLQDQLWQTVRPQAAAQPNPVTALVVSGMNDVLNSQGYTQFAWWNRLPTSAWTMMLVIAVFANLLVGFAKKPSRTGNLLLLVVPLMISVAFYLVADMDTPRAGRILVRPVNLVSLSQSIHASVR